MTWFNLVLHQMNGEGFAIDRLRADPRVPVMAMVTFLFPTFAIVVISSMGSFVLHSGDVRSELLWALVTIARSKDEQRSNHQRDMLLYPNRHVPPPRRMQGANEQLPTPTVGRQSGLIV